MVHRDRTTAGSRHRAIRNHHRIPLKNKRRAAVRDGRGRVRYRNAHRGNAVATRAHRCHRVVRRRAHCRRRAADAARRLGKTQASGQHRAHNKAVHRAAAAHRRVRKDAHTLHRADARTHVSNRRNRFGNRDAHNALAAATRTLCCHRVVRTRSHYCRRAAEDTAHAVQTQARRQCRTHMIDSDRTTATHGRVRGNRCITQCGDGRTDIGNGRRRELYRNTHHRAAITARACRRHRVVRRGSCHRRGATDEAAHAVKRQARRQCRAHVVHAHSARAYKHHRIRNDAGSRNTTDARTHVGDVRSRVRHRNAHHALAIATRTCRRHRVVRGGRHHGWRAADAAAHAVKRQARRQCGTHVVHVHSACTHKHCRIRSDRNVLHRAEACAHVADGRSRVLNRDVQDRRVQAARTHGNHRVVRRG